MNVRYSDMTEQRKIVTRDSTGNKSAFSPVRRTLPCQKTIVSGRHHGPHRRWRSNTFRASLIAIGILAAGMVIGRRWAPFSDRRPTSSLDPYETATVFERQALAPPLIFEAHTQNVHAYAARRSMGRSRARPEIQ
jgi:hypothetical protein